MKQKSGKSLESTSLCRSSVESICTSHCSQVAHEFTYALSLVQYIALAPGLCRILLRQVKQLQIVSHFIASSMIELS